MQSKKGKFNGNKSNNNYAIVTCISQARMMYGVYYIVETQGRKADCTCSLFRILMQSVQAGPLSIPHIPSCVEKSFAGSVNSLPQ